jgi:hypothetical protein
VRAALDTGMVVAWSMLSYVSVTVVFFTAGLVVGSEVLFSPVADDPV